MFWKGTNRNPLCVFVCLTNLASLLLSTWVCCCACLLLHRAILVAEPSEFDIYSCKYLQEYFTRESDIILYTVFFFLVMWCSDVILCCHSVFSYILFANSGQNWSWSCVQASLCKLSLLVTWTPSLFVPFIWQRLFFFFTHLPPLQYRSWPFMPN